jgi:hypothetical protein
VEWGDAFVCVPVCTRSCALAVPVPVSACMVMRACVVCGWHAVCVAVRGNSCPCCAWVLAMGVFMRAFASQSKTPHARKLMVSSSSMPCVCRIRHTAVRQAGTRLTVTERGPTASILRESLLGSLHAFPPVAAARLIEAVMAATKMWPVRLIACQCDRDALDLQTDVWFGGEGMAAGGRAAGQPGNNSLSASS